MNIGLGTAQFGLDYGISNPAGRVSVDEVRRILDEASRGGVSVLDTAAAYGDAEAVLGQLLPDDHRFRLVTKLPRLPAGLSSGALRGWVRDTFQQSLARLRVERVDGLLMHSAQDLLPLEQGAAIWDALRELRAEGRASKIGASVYGAAEIDALTARFDLQLIQLPISLLDQRLLASGHLAKLKSSSVEVHARSLLLQGLLTLDPAALPAHFAVARPTLLAFRAALAEQKLTPIEAAVAFAAAVPQIDHAIFGVTRAEELSQLIAAGGRVLALAWFAPYALRDERILNPALWPKLA